jgi:NAD(P)-dependent dehydrogenase (short-subunit alcohol dehydrogenase family)
MDDGMLRGKAAIVTGGSKGIGRAVAEAMARAGADVLVTSRHADEVEAAAREMSAATGGRVEGMACDVRDAAAVRAMVEACVQRFGGLHVLINNAGVSGGFAPVDEITVERWDQVIETNLSGVFYACRAAVPVMREGGGGWIINVASLAGKNPFAGGTAYNASKFGLVGFTEALMLDVREHDIRVCSIMPGSVNTHFFPGGPAPEHAWMLQPEDIARTVMDLLRYPDRALPSRIEIRPSRPGKR